MSTTKTAVINEARLLREGWGEGAWHGPDLKAALADVTAQKAFARPAAGRHNIAEIALHHAYCVRGVRARLSGQDPEAFVLPGEDWFALDSASTLSWKKVQETLAREQAALEKAFADADAGRLRSPLPESERLDLALGVTCHAVYHAGQVQLIKKMLER